MVHIFGPVPAPSFQSRQRLEQDCDRPSSLHSLVIVVSWNPSSQLSCRMLGPHTSVVLCRIMGPRIAVLSCRMLGPHTSFVLCRIMGPRNAVLSCRTLGPSSSAEYCRMLGPHTSVVLCRMLGPSTSAVSLQNVEDPTHLSRVLGSNTSPASQNAQAFLADNLVGSCRIFRPHTGAVSCDLTPQAASQTNGRALPSVSTAPCPALRTRVSVVPSPLAFHVPHPALCSGFEKRVIVDDH